METIIIVLLSAILIIVVAVLFLSLNSKAKNSSSDNSLLLKELKEIEIKMNSFNLEFKLENSKNFHDNFLVIANKLSQLQLDTSNTLNKNSEELVKKSNELKIELINLFNSNFKDLNNNVDTNLKKVNEKVEQRLNEGFERTNKTFADILVSLTKIDEASKNIEKLSGEVVSLQDILDNNQKRGAFGEFALNQILSSVFGDNQELYKTQYSLKDDNDAYRVDAVIILPEPYKLLSIDSKFPYSNYEAYNEATTEEQKIIALRDFKNDMKKHIHDIKSKYIIAGKTANQALMFVPSDGVLAFIHAKTPSIIDDAAKNKVYITSPSTLLPVLSSIQSLKISQDRAENAEKIRISLEKLGKDFRLFSEDWTKLSNSLNQVVNRTLSIDKRVDKINNQFGKISNVEELENTDDLISIE